LGLGIGLGLGLDRDYDVRSTTCAHMIWSNRNRNRNRNRYRNPNPNQATCAHLISSRHIGREKYESCPLSVTMATKNLQFLAPSSIAAMSRLVHIYITPSHHIYASADVRYVRTVRVHTHIHAHAHAHAHARAHARTHACMYVHVMCMCMACSCACACTASSKPLVLYRVIGASGPSALDHMHVEPHGLTHFLEVAEQHLRQHNCEGIPLR